eukprot:gene4380-795_t
MNSDQVVRLTSVFAKLGMSKVRLTGGEPLLRPDVIELADRSVCAFEVFCILPVLFARLSRLASGLRSAGVSGVNISLDTLNSDRFSAITRRSSAMHTRALAAVESALSHGFGPVKVNCVVMKGINDDEVPDFVTLARDKAIQSCAGLFLCCGATVPAWPEPPGQLCTVRFCRLAVKLVRFIEFMPFSGNRWGDDRLVPSHVLREAIESRHGALSPCGADDPSQVATEFTLKGYSGSVGATDDDLVSLIQHAVLGKHALLGGHESPDDIAQHPQRSMVAIGG